MIDVDLLGEKVRLWFVRVAPLVTLRAPQSEHLDDLLGAELAGASRMAFGLAALRALIDLLDAEARSVMPLLVVPLGPSESLDTEAPDQLEHLAESAAEPPGLYLVRREARVLWESNEEYRSPLSGFSLPEISGGQLVAYYRCFRGAEAFANDWEYERCVYVEYYPHGLLF